MAGVEATNIAKTRIRDRAAGSTKFVLSVLGVLVLFIASLAGKFSGEFAFSTVSIVVTYVTGNAFITGKALANGKHPNGLEK